MKPDPRLYQIATLASLLAYGLIRLDFEIPLVQAASMLGTALVTQFACTRLWRLPAFDPRSALISGLSLCLLLRTNSLSLSIAAAIVTVGSKFLIRIRGKHVFNPDQLRRRGDDARDGSCGSRRRSGGMSAFFAFLMACLGGLVVNRAARSDVTFAFIVFYMSLVFGRSLWLGEPLAIPLHRLQSGALLLFTFFMISDPRTTPDSRVGRMLFAVLVASGAWYVQFRLFRTNGLLWSLAFCSLHGSSHRSAPSGTRYAWSRPTIGRLTPNGVTHETIDSGSRSGRGLRVVGRRRCSAFCGFYVAKADTKLFNRASQVVLVRDGDRTVLTMANDFKGEPKEFAVVVPVPTVLQKRADPRRREGARSITSTPTPRRAWSSTSTRTRAGLR